MTVAARVSDVLDNCEIVTFDDAPPPAGESPWVAGQDPMTELRVVPADPLWPESYRMLAAVITEALGDVALAVEHVGSTAVPGLPAKPVIDIDLTAADSRNEQAYVPALERRGFVLVIREPRWYEHRCLRREDPACILHVFSPDCAETERHRIFRDWLRSHPKDSRSMPRPRPPPRWTRGRPAVTRWTTTRARSTSCGRSTAERSTISASRPDNRGQHANLIDLVDRGRCPTARPATIAAPALRYARAFATTVAGTSSPRLCPSGRSNTFHTVTSTTLSLVVDRQTGSGQRRSGRRAVSAHARSTCAVAAADPHAPDT